MSKLYRSETQADWIIYLFTNSAAPVILYWVFSPATQRKCKSTFIVSHVIMEKKLMDFRRQLLMFCSTLMRTNSSSLPWPMWLFLYPDLNGCGAICRKQSNISSRPTFSLFGVCEYYQPKLRYLSRHCLPMRPGKCFAMSDHFSFPCFPTSSMIRSSSSWKSRHKNKYRS